MKLNELLKFDSSLEIAKNAKDMPFYEKEKVKFNNFNKRFAVFNRKME